MIVHSGASLGLFAVRPTFSWRLHLRHMCWHRGSSYYSEREEQFTQAIYCQRYGCSVKPPCLAHNDIAVVDLRTKTTDQSRVRSQSSTPCDVLYSRFLAFPVKAHAVLSLSDSMEGHNIMEGCAWRQNAPHVSRLRSFGYMLDDATGGCESHRFGVTGRSRRYVC